MAEAVQSDFADVNGTRLHYLTAGQGVLESGHWLMEEAPGRTIPAPVEFLGR